MVNIMKTASVVDKVVLWGRKNREKLM